MKKPIRFDLLRGEHGASLIELAFLLPLFLLLVMGAVDFGRAFYLSTEVAGAAHAAAMYGAQHPTDITGMESAANDDAPNVTLSFPTASYGCECPYSTTSTYSASCASAPSSCSTSYVYRVNITVQGTYHPLFPWPGIPSPMSLSSSASMRSAGSA